MEQAVQTSETDKNTANVSTEVQQPLTADEAAALLLALGQPLEWSENGYSLAINNIGDFYAAQWDTQKWGWVAGFMGIGKPTFWNPCVYKSYNAAKSACNRHYTLLSRIKPELTSNKPCYGEHRYICEWCGNPIKGSNPIASRTAVGVITERAGVFAGTGFVHPACQEATKTLLDLTGRPDYSPYDEDGANPAYPEDFDPVERGRSFDEAMRQERARLDTEGKTNAKF